MFPSRKLRPKQYTRFGNLRYGDISPIDTHQSVYLLPLLLIPGTPLRTFTYGIITCTNQFPTGWIWREIAG